jgi:hypothetical protein
MPHEAPHGIVSGWAIVARPRTGGASPALHVVGYLLAHARLSPQGELDGEPYIGSELASLDLSQGVARNHRGKLIVLDGPAQPPGEVGSLPGPLKAMMQRAERAWSLGPTDWFRHDAGQAPASAP